MDLGTNNIKIYNKAEDSFFLEKNMIAIENKNTLLAYGDSAFDMYEKAPANIHTSYPVYQEYGDPCKILYYGSVKGHFKTK